MRSLPLRASAILFIQAIYVSKICSKLNAIYVHVERVLKRNKTFA
jgi:hypothetical protein